MEALTSRPAACAAPKIVITRAVRKQRETSHHAQRIRNEKRLAPTVESTSWAEDAKTVLHGGHGQQEDIELSRHGTLLASLHHARGTEKSKDDKNAKDTKPVPALRGAQGLTWLGVSFGTAVVVVLIVTQFAPAGARAALWQRSCIMTASNVACRGRKAHSR